MTLVDTNVLLDILSRDAQWMDWSFTNLMRRRSEGPLFINEVVYAEMAGHVRTESELDGAVQDLELKLGRTPKSALFLAGEVFRRYRRSGGTRTGVLPDFFIGAHAQVDHLPILTRDTRHYRTYFPKVELITP